VRTLLVGSKSLPHFIAKLLGRFHFDERPTHATVDVSPRICRATDHVSGTSIEGEVHAFLI